MLSCAGLGDKTGLAHLFGQQRLPQHIVDFMRACMVQVLTLEVDFGTAQILGHLLRVVQPGGTPCIVVQQRGQFPVELRVFFIVVVCLFQFDHGIHQRFGNILPAMDAKTPVRVCHTFSSFLTAAAKAAIFSASFLPAVSMPELTSTA